MTHIVPSLLVFGEYSQAFSTSQGRTSRTNANKRAFIAETARVEMAKLVRNARIVRALKHSASPSADDPLRAGCEVLVWSENMVKNRIGEWLGPFTVDRYYPNKTLVFVQTEESKLSKPFGVAQVKLYLQPDRMALSFLVGLK